MGLEEGIGGNKKSKVNEINFFIHEIYHLLNIIHKEKLSFSHLFSSKIGDLSENVRLEGPEIQAIVCSSGPEKQAISLL